tara:strand:+ start:4952 stop:5425 length:474 start_codon:yes stop_codon:yes gene_type:complete
MDGIICRSHGGIGTGLLFVGVVVVISSIVVIGERCVIQVPKIRISGWVYARRQDYVFTGRFDFDTWRNIIVSLVVVRKKMMPSSAAGQADPHPVGQISVIIESGLPEMVSISSAVDVNGNYATGGASSQSYVELRILPPPMADLVDISCGVQAAATA